MRILIYETGVSLWLSALDTERWARRPGAAWPCSQLSGHQLRADFDRSGLVDLTIDGRYGDIDSTEFNAITSDFIAERLPRDHPCWFVCVGQFQDGFPAVDPATGEPIV